MESWVESDNLKIPWKIKLLMWRMVRAGLSSITEETGNKLKGSHVLIYVK